MATVSVYTMTGEVTETIELKDSVFGIIPNVPVLHQVMVAQLVNRRQGNASTKTRSHVRGGGAKPWRQKGTGHARQGSRRSAQWRGGGVIFGPLPHPYHHSVNRKVRRLALRSALSDKVANGKLLLVNQFELEEAKTKRMVAFLDTMPIEKNVLILIGDGDEDDKVQRATRNLPYARALNVAGINLLEILRHEHLIMPLAVARHIETLFDDSKPGQEEAAEDLDASVNEGKPVPDTQEEAVAPLAGDVEGHTPPPAAQEGRA